MVKRLTQQPVAPLEILFRDQHLIAVNKPPGLLVHRTRIAEAEDEDFVLQRLRSQIGHRVYTAHRLDRPTSGVLLFGLDSDAGRRLSQLFEDRAISKRYIALVRGYTDERGEIDYALQDGPHQTARNAVTRYQRIATVELPFSVGRYPTSRYSLLQVDPLSGRYHQIRRHFHHIHHPLIGDTTHGEGRHNRFFREHFGIERLLLHAQALTFEHPYTGQPLSIGAAPDGQWRQLVQVLGWSASVLTN